MNDLLGGLKCPYCGYDFEPSDMKGSNYLCIGLDMNANRKEVTVWAYSTEEAVTKAENKGVLFPICYPGEYYNTAPVF